MNANKEAMAIALHELKHLEQQWRSQMRNMLVAGFGADTTIDTLQHMTYVQRQLDNTVLKFEEESK
jgi:hypothetical protein